MSLVFFSQRLKMIGCVQTHAVTPENAAVLNSSTSAATVRACSVVWTRSLRHRKSTCKSGERRRRRYFSAWRWRTDGRACQATPNVVRYCGYKRQWNTQRWVRAEPHFYSSGVAICPFYVFLLIRPDSSGRAYVLSQMFFLFRHAFSEVPRPIALKLCHMIGNWLNFIIQVQKFGVGRKRAKFRSILYHFRLWSRISPEGLKISKIDDEN